jgi:hypothetical protein
VVTRRVKDAVRWDLSWPELGSDLPVDKPKTSSSYCPGRALPGTGPKGSFTGMPCARPYPSFLAQNYKLPRGETLQSRIWHSLHPEKGVEGPGWPSCSFHSLHARKEGWVREKGRRWRGVKGRDLVEGAWVSAVNCLIFFLYIYFLE